MIEACNLHKFFGAFHAVRGVTLHVAPGEVVALLGPNGAGKTTTVRMLSAILRPSEGYARVAGYDVVEQAREVRRVVGLLTEFPGLYLRMRPLEYLCFFGALQGMSASDSARRAEQLLRRFGLWEARDKRLDSFSKGMKQKIALIRALIHDPPVLYLDEPTTAMDPHSARQVRDAMLELRAAKRTILLTTHNLAEAEELADRIAIIRNGSIVAEGTFAQLTRQFLGAPRWELRLGTSAQRAVAVLDGAVHIEHIDGDSIYYHTDDARSVNPQIVARLADAGIPIVALNELPQRLEDVYLEIVAGSRRADAASLVEQPTQRNEAPVTGEAVALNVEG
ncbi:MAG: ABC transporter ATP-binding protein [Roseiflexus sp.]|nr:ABC transporter ATP-binding protein [Roseiflexus sp.]MCS7288990.1 ABC transporter ATP-binding protein [Roseiflexus sp.]MDW8147107.1 ABC transporter ATP-binding protein [Roseiflexaceae bacterium]MDW8231704.1 ABC transporter ATP-binding protein [Roseiflexaceae bacterium]